MTSASQIGNILASTVLPADNMLSACGRSPVGPGMALAAITRRAPFSPDREVRLTSFADVTIAP